MTDVLDPASIIESAQQAVAAGDFSAAERLLREAAAAQEASLGPEHPDLASTLNNLAFVCERTNNVAEAERNYRRAHAIAVASLGPRHPFVATSIKNLVDFCAAHDIPIWKPPAETLEADASLSIQGATSDPEISELEAAQAEADADWDVDTAPESLPATRSIGLPTIALAALAVVIIVGVAFTMRSRITSAPRETPAPPSSSTTPVIAREADPPAAVDAKPATAIAPSRVERTEPRAKVEASTPRDKTVASQLVTVLKAQLCKTLVKNGSPDWQCALPAGNLRPGTYSFYTRLMTNSGATVEHRWYLGGRVHQVMRLRITPNPNGGYRTYSSNTISAERAGDWRVELRAADGTLLHEERFVVK